MFAFKCLHCLAPSYFSDLLDLHSLRLLIRLGKAKAQVAFGATAPNVWNKLAINIRQAPSIPILKSCLKMQLFSLACGFVCFCMFPVHTINVKWCVTELLCAMCFINKVDYIGVSK